MIRRALAAAAILGDQPLRLVAWLRTTGGHGLWIALWSAVGLGGTVAAPVLLGSPVLLMALTPRAMFVALAATKVDLTVFVLLGLVRLSIADFSYFLLGRRAESTVTSTRARRSSRRRWSPAGLADRCVRGICHSPLSAALVLFLRPSGRVMGVAGAYGVPIRVAAAASITGTVTYLIAMHQGAQWLT